ncbi:MAG: VWA domain-containing protein [Clostridia bacterium]|nr:VWA domain-containing protein [Clostridia bacterium]
MNYGKVKKLSAILLMMVFTLCPLVYSTACAVEFTEGVTQSKIVSSVSNEAGYDVVICVDNSASIWEQQKVRNEAIQGIVGLAVGSDSDIRIGGVYFGKTVGKTMPLTSVKEEADSKSVLEFFSNTDKDDNNKGTNIGAALDTASSWFQSSDASRERVIILFSDGKNDTDEANIKTADVVPQLKAKDVDIYCVYVQKDTGSDEAYLKSLVNYFEQSNANDNRLKSVAEKDIKTLPVEFSKIFYAMQNDMQCHVITASDFDADGNYSFNIPELAVSKLQVNLTPQGNIQYAGDLTSENDTGEIHHWVSGSNLFFSTKSPAAGQWNLKISDCDDMSAIYGTAAFYTDMQAQIELQQSDGNIPSGVYKNIPMQAVVHFYDADQEEIAVDHAAEVTVTVSMTSADGQTDEKKLSTTIDDNGCVSEPFTLAVDGIFSIGTELQYDDYLQLSYQNMLTADITNQAPAATNLSNSTFSAQKKDAGMEFQIPVSDLFTDPEGGELTISTDITQKNRDNPVEIQVENGVIYVTAQSTGDVAFEVTAADEEGNSSTAVVQGTVESKSVQKMKGILMRAIVVVVVVLLLLILLIKQKGKNDKAKREAERAAQEQAVQESLADAAEKLDRALEDYKEAYKGVSKCYGFTQRVLGKADEAGADLREVRDNLDQELQKNRQSMTGEQKERQEKRDRDLLSLLGADAVLQEKSHSQISMPEDDTEQEEAECETLKNMQNKAEAVRRMKQAADELRNKKETLHELCQMLEGVKTEAEEWTMKANEKREEIATQQEMPIPYTLKLRFPAFGLRGQKSNATGWYQLNDIVTFEHGRKTTMGEATRNCLDLWIFGRNNAVLLCCTELFDIRNTNEDQSETVNEKLLAPGTYQIKKGAADFEITIE